VDAVKILYMAGAISAINAIRANQAISAINAIKADAISNAATNKVEE
jgi:hypothetical protein